MKRPGPPAKTPGVVVPVPVRLAGLLAALWYASACREFVLVATRDPDQMAAFTPAMIDWLDAALIWWQLAWGLHIAAGLGGSLLLMAGRKEAALGFLLALVALLLATLCRFVLDPQPVSDPLPIFAMSRVAWLLTFMLALASEHLRRARQLR